jgi:hypothetical protein
MSGGDLISTEGTRTFPLRWCNLGIKEFKGEGNGYLMDREYQYVFVGNSDHHEFLSHSPDQLRDPLFKKGIANL